MRKRHASQYANFGSLLNKLHFIPFAILTFTLFYKHIFAQFKN